MVYLFTYNNVNSVCIKSYFNTENDIYVFAEQILSNFRESINGECRMSDDSFIIKVYDIINDFNNIDDEDEIKCDGKTDFKT